jgi:hypothetical protein
MKLDESHPFNRRILHHAKGKNAREPAIASPDSHSNPYWDLGSHPDIVERVWDGIGAIFPEDCRAIVYGTPALVHPGKGIVLAMAYGTAYIIRVPDDLVDAAIQAGCAIERHWANGCTTNIQEELGYGWLFGNWLDEEAHWLLETGKRFSSMPCR